MIKHFKILLIISLTLSLEVHSQQILAGFQLGPNYGYPQRTDNSYLGLEGVWGINMALVNKKGILLEIGRYRNAIDYSTAIRASGYLTSFRNDIRAEQIPLRLQKKINIIKSKIFLSPSIGFSYLYHVNPHISYANGNGYNRAYWLNGDTVFYSQNNQSLHKNGFLAETGAKVEFIILKYVSFNIACYYSYGLHSLAKTTYTYNEPSANKSGEIEVTTRGNNLQFFVGLSYIIYDKQRKAEKVELK